MATSTFSGPIKAGTIKATTGTTVGENVVNVGFAVMAQSVVIDITGASHLNQVCATVPANSQIIDERPQFLLVLLMMVTHSSMVKT
jgi:hypothetical protein